MRKIDEVLKQAAELTAAERRQLIDVLEQGLADDGLTETESARRAALTRWLGRAGTGHSEHTDVSSDKYKHLAAAYTDT
jgi:hypothetical protein